jgi:hypothetical protein
MQTKVACGLVLTGFALFCAGELFISRLIYQSFELTYLRNGFLLPQLTVVLIAHPYWLLAAPVPWLLWLIVEKKSRGPFELFTATILVVTVIIFFLVLIAWLLPVLNSPAATG